MLIIHTSTEAVAPYPELPCSSATPRGKVDESLTETPTWGVFNRGRNDRPQPEKPRPAFSGEWSHGTKFEGTPNAEIVSKAAASSAAT